MGASRRSGRQPGRTVESRVAQGQPWSFGGNHDDLHRVAGPSCGTGLSKKRLVRRRGPRLDVRAERQAVLDGQRLNAKVGVAVELRHQVDDRALQREVAD